MTSFYAVDGSDLSTDRYHSKCVSRLQKHFHEHKDKPLPADFKSSLNGPSVVWKIFKRLNMAISYARSCTKDAMVFAFEEKASKTTGQRMFLVTHPYHMWLNHKLRPPMERCSYEIIQEGAPCKLYFDLEFEKAVNPNTDGNELTHIFIQCVIAGLKDLYHVHSRLSDVMWLDASTETKYSCHLIFQLNDTAFKNNIQIGFFVTSLLSSIKRRIQENLPFDEFWPASSDLKKLLIVTKDGSKAFFCDEGVYTKNRNFRLYLSTKIGKNAPLLISKENKYIPQDDTQIGNYEELLFLDSLITFFRVLKHSLNLLCNETEISTPVLRYKDSTSSITENGNVSKASHSPFPNVDSFVLSIVSDHFKTGFIRKWTYFKEEETLLYDIGNYRFCTNIGRHHKSNNIMIVVEIKSGCYYQKCYDPQCRMQGFKSEVHPLPEDVAPCPSLPENFFDTESVFTQMNSCKETFKPEQSQNPRHTQKIIDKCSFNDVLSKDYFDLITHDDENIMMDTFKDLETTEFFFSLSSVNDSKKKYEDHLPESIDFPICNSAFFCSWSDCSHGSWGKTGSEDSCVSSRDMENLSADDELAMVFAADVAEVTFDVGMLDAEETIF